jgi:hypothetical protein
MLSASPRLRTNNNFGVSKPSKFLITVEFKGKFTAAKRDFREVLPCSVSV